MPLLHVCIYIHLPFRHLYLSSCTHADYVKDGSLVRLNLTTVDKYVDSKCAYPGSGRKENIYESFSLSLYATVAMLPAHCGATHGCWNMNRVECGDEKGSVEVGVGTGEVVGATRKSLDYWNKLRGGQGATDAQYSRPST